jgi:peroxiredoxin Q/BCP
MGTARGLAHGERFGMPTGRRRVTVKREGRMTMKRWTGIWLVMLFSALLLLLNASPTMALNVGDKAPDFALPGTTAEKISLSDYLGKKPIVVFSYLYAFTGL